MRWSGAPSQTRSAKAQDFWLFLSPHIVLLWRAHPSRGVEEVAARAVLQCVSVACPSPRGRADHRGARPQVRRLLRHGGGAPRRRVRAGARRRAQGRPPRRWRARQAARPKRGRCGSAPGGLVACPRMAPSPRRPLRASPSAKPGTLCGGQRAPPGTRLVLIAVWRRGAWHSKMPRVDRSARATAEKSATRSKVWQKRGRGRSGGGSPEERGRRERRFRAAPSPGPGEPPIERHARVRTVTETELSAVLVPKAMMARVASREVGVEATSTADSAADGSPPLGCDEMGVARLEELQSEDPRAAQHPRVGVATHHQCSVVADGGLSDQELHHLLDGRLRLRALGGFAGARRGDAVATSAGGAPLAWAASHPQGGVTLFAFCLRALQHVEEHAAICARARRRNCHTKAARARAHRAGGPDRRLVGTPPAQGRTSHSGRTAPAHREATHVHPSREVASVRMAVALRRPHGFRAFGSCGVALSLNRLSHASDRALGRCSQGMLQATHSPPAQVPDERDDPGEPR